MQKRSLIELKKKYNFYDDDSSSSSSDNEKKRSEEEVPRESGSSGEKHFDDEDIESSLVTPVREEVKIRMQIQPPQRTADSRIDSLSQFLKDEPIDEECSIGDYSKLEESKDEARFSVGMYDEIEGKLDRILNKHSDLLNKQRDAEDQLFEKATMQDGEDTLSEMELY